jgi:hypothetical protein
VLIVAFIVTAILFGMAKPLSQADGLQPLAVNRAGTSLDIIERDTAASR